MGLDALSNPDTVSRLNKRRKTRELEKGGKKGFRNTQRAISSSRNNPGAATSPGSTVLSGLKAESPGGTTLLRTG